VAEVPRLAADTADKVERGTRVKLILPELIAGREGLITFDVSDESTGRPVDDLEPYLGATGHLLLASADLEIAAHSHPVAGVSTSGGPTIVFQVLFPRAAAYRMWMQFQRRGEVITVPFTVPVGGR
jgi:metallophosphoesterase superfamily enzyme